VEQLRSEDAGLLPALGGGEQTVADHGSANPHWPPLYTQTRTGADRRIRCLSEKVGRRTAINLCAIILGTTASLDFLGQQRGGVPLKGQFERAIA
jgi:hypothetical protein